MKTTPVSGARCRTATTLEEFKQALADNLYFVRGQPAYSASDSDRFMTLCYTVRDQLIRDWQKTEEAYYKQNPRTVYYLSAEYLLGRQLPQNLLYTGTTDMATRALTEFGHEPEDIFGCDVEPGLGNGGLGRLAACFLDSLATLGLPCVGYGIRYEFGIFRQQFADGWQVESPDDWLFMGNPWEFPQPDDMVSVGFGGYTELYEDGGQQRTRWVPGETVLGEPYHMLVPGYGSGVVNLLRLWRARASKEFDFQLFDEGDFPRAVAQKVSSENISKVLYPNDNTPQGRELRLRQQYFFVACSLRDILRIFSVRNGDNWDALPDKAVIQLNDTHPVLAIPELMRLLVDEYELEWDRAWGITRRTFASTQHTLLPEAMERWPVRLLGRILPRHLQIIYEINHRFLGEVQRQFPGDSERRTRMSIIEEGSEKLVRMAYLACVGSFSVNGVAELQSRLLAERVIPDFAEMWPDKFNNKTNGVTPRRFMRLANPLLSELLDRHIGDGWVSDLDQLTKLEPLARKKSFRKAWRKVKSENKRVLAGIIEQQLDLQVNPDSIFDVMVKRLHEYKRQLLKVLHIITLYHRVIDQPGADIFPRTFIFGAKAAPGYRMAKQIIKLINSVADVVNDDGRTFGRLKVAYLPNFNVTLGEQIYPAADLSEQISLAGKEASGTGNMKMALNGAVTVGTLDGANIEIRECVGEENFFLFGLTAEEVFEVKARGYQPYEYYQSDEELRRALDAISSGYFSEGDPSMFKPIIESLLGSDEYLVLADYRAYVDCQDRVAEAFRNQDDWDRMSILNTARCGFFSSDRTMTEYSRDIWKLKPLEL